MKKQLTTTLLPNKKKVFCLQAEETQVLYKQIQSYLKYGIKVKEKDIVFDIGANIGLFSLMINDLCAGQGNIYSFEPMPKIFEVLEQNANKFNPNKIKAFQIGLGERSQITEFTYYPNATAISSLYPDSSKLEKHKFANILKENLSELPYPQDLIKYLPEPFLSFVIDRLVDLAFIEQKVECQIKTLSQVIAEQSIDQIDLLKIDVEKAELDVLRGIEAKDWSKIKQIVIEVHNLKDRVQKIINLFKEQGFSQIYYEQDFVLKSLNIYTVYAMK